MHRIVKLISIIFLSLISLVSVAQKTDSLLNELYKAKTKKHLIEIYIELGNKLRYAYPDSAMIYYKQGLVLARLEKDKSAEADVIGSIGSVWAIKHEYDSATILINQAIKLNEKIDNAEGLAKSLNSLALIYMRQEKPEEAKRSLTQTVLLARELNDSVLLSKVYNNFGLLFKRQHDYDTALYYYHESMKIKEELNDSDGVGRTASNIALIYEEISEFELALRYLNQSYSIRKATGDEYGLAIVLNNYGLVYESMGDLDKALINYQKSFRIMNKLKKEARMATVHNNLGSVYNKQKKYKIGFEHLNKALEINKRIGNARGELISTMELAGFYEKLKIYQNAVYMYRQALDISGKVNDIALISEVQEGLYYAYENLNMYDSALYFYKIYTAINDSIFNTYSKRNIEKLELEYQALKREKENQDLVRQNQAKEEKLKRVLLGGAVLLVVLALIIIFSLFSVTSRRKLEKTYQLVLDQRNNIQLQSTELEKAYKKLQEFTNFKEELTSMIVHDLKNPLNIILNISDIKNYPDKDQVILQSGKQMLNMVMNILDVYKYEDQAFQLDLKELYINGVIEKVIGELAFVLSEKSVKIKHEIDYDFMVNIDEAAIERVIVNLLTNAIKFSPQGGVIRIVSQPLKNNRFRLHVIDSGEGIPKESIDQIFLKFEQRKRKKLGYSGSTGIGLTYCKMAIQAHGGIIGVDSEPGKGADFYFELAYNDTKISELEENDTKESYIVLSKDTRRQLYPVIVSLQERDIYEVTEIRNILKQINRSNNELHKFCTLIENSVLNCNQIMYDELLELALSKE